LKPSNVLICLYDRKPVPKVIDFGLAKAMYQPLTDHTLHTGHGLMLARAWLQVAINQGSR
jgi:eukaryotic-like serine/threonine-protein kinase